MANETAPVWKRTTDTEKTRAIIIERLALVQKLGREAKDAFVAELGCHNLASSISGLGAALEAEAKARWCRSVLKRMSREPMFAVLQSEVALLKVRIKVMMRAYDGETTRMCIHRSHYEAYVQLATLFSGTYYLPRLEAVMAAENIADSPWTGE